MDSFVQTHNAFNSVTASHHLLHDTTETHKHTFITLTSRRDTLHCRIGRVRVESSTGFGSAPKNSAPHRYATSTKVYSCHRQSLLSVTIYEGHSGRKRRIGRKRQPQIYAC